MQEENNHISFTAEDIRRYHEGKLTPAQMHALEKASLEDPFLADALEGYAVEEVNVPADIDDLKHRLKKRLEEKDEKVIPIAVPVKPIRWLRVAAMIVAVGGAGLLVYNLGFKTSAEEKTIAQEVKRDVKKDTPMSDSMAASDTSRIQQPAAITTAPDQTIVTSKQQQKNLDDKQQGEKAAWFKSEAENAEKAKAEADAEMASKRKEASVMLRKQAEPVPSSPAISSADDYRKMDTLRTSRAAGLAVSKNEEAKDIRIRGFSSQDKDVAEKKGFVQQNQATNNTLGYQNNSNQQPSKARRQLSMQQSVNVFRGKVTDDQNNPLPFANITNLSDDVGTYADAQGNFVLTSPDSVMNVQVKSLGFENNLTQLQNGLTSNRIALKDDNSLSPIVLSNKPSNARQKQGSMVLEEPEPADGWTKYDAYLANNLKLPDTYKTKPQESGEVALSFEVNSLGEPINIKVEKSLCEVCDKEAIRLLKEGPKWKRKAKKGKRTTITIPF